MRYLRFFWKAFFESFTSRGFAWLCNFQTGFGIYFLVFAEKEALGVILLLFAAINHAADQIIMEIRKRKKILNIEESLLMALANLLEDRRNEKDQ